MNRQHYCIPFGEQYQQVFTNEFYTASFVSFSNLPYNALKASKRVTDPNKSANNGRNNSVISNMDKYVLNKFIDHKKSDYLSRYLEVIKKLLQEWESDIKKINMETEDEEEYGKREEYLVSEAEDKENVEQIMLAASIVSIFAFIEKMITDLCDIIQKRRGQLFSYKDLKGIDGIEKALKYLEKITQAKFPADRKAYEDLKIAQQVRNTIIHNESKIDNRDKNNRIQLFIKNNPSLIKFDDDKLVFNYEYAESLIELNEKILKEYWQMVEEGSNPE